MEVIAPAHQRTVVKSGASEFIASRNGNGCSTNTKVDWICWRRSLHGGVTQPQLPVVVAPPTLHRAIVENGAGVRPSSRNGYSRSA